MFWNMIFFLWFYISFWQHIKYILLHCIMSSDEQTLISSDGQFKTLQPGFMTSVFTSPDWQSDRKDFKVLLSFFSPQNPLTCAVILSNCLSFCVGCCALPIFWREFPKVSHKIFGEEAFVHFAFMGPNCRTGDLSTHWAECVEMFQQLKC